jgi:hypothetical protein
MYARLLALVCLLPVGALVAGPHLPAAAGDELVLYLRHQPGVPAGVIEAMQREVSALMQPVGVRVRWVAPGERAEAAAGSLAVVELMGQCSASMPDTHSGSSAPLQRLGYTAVSNGRVLPFSWLDCSALQQFLSPALDRQSKGKRDFFYGRALGRILAHEVYHVLARTVEHTREGIAEPKVSVVDLMSERFEFQEAGIAKLRSTAESLEQTDSESVTSFGP